MQLLTRAQIRDRVRRMAGITPPIDPQPGTGVPVPGAAAGDLPPGYPDPSNEVINNALEVVVSELNLTLGYHVEGPVTVSVPAMPVTYYGVEWLDLQPIGTFAGSVDTLRSCIWTVPSEQIRRRLQPTTYSDILRNDVSTESQPPSQPNAYLVEGYHLGLYPASATAGQVVLALGTGTLAPETDSDTLDGIPADWQPYILDGILLQVGARLAEDAEWQAKMGVYAPLWARGLSLMAKNLLQQTSEYEPRVPLDSYRRGYGTQRLRT